MRSNPLNEVLSPKARRVLYAVLWVAALAFAAWKAADGDWLEAVAGLVTALYGGMAQANTPTPETTEVH